MANLAALRAAVFSLSAKNLRGGLKSTPPAGARVKITDDVIWAPVTRSSTPAEYHHTVRSKYLRSTHRGQSLYTPRSESLHTIDLNLYTPRSESLHAPRSKYLHTAVRVSTHRGPSLYTPRSESLHTAVRVSTHRGPSLKTPWFISTAVSRGLY